MFLIAAGSLFVYLAQRQHSTRDSAKSQSDLNDKVGSVLTAIGEVRKDISDAKSTNSATSGHTPSSSVVKQASERLDVIEKDFKKWADSFVASQTSKKLGFDQLRLNQLGIELANTQKCRTRYQSWLRTIVELVDAYNESVGKKEIVADVPPLPENLYAPKQRANNGTLTFAGKAKWLFDIVCSKPADASQVPTFVIAFSTIDNGERYTGEIEFRSGDQSVVVVSRLFELPSAELDGTYKIPEDDQKLTQLFKSLVERQLLAISGR